MREEIEKILKYHDIGCSHEGEEEITTQFLSLFQKTIEEVIGKDEDVKKHLEEAGYDSEHPEYDEEASYMEGHINGSNQLRAKQRAKAKEILNDKSGLYEVLPYIKCEHCDNINPKYLKTKENDN